MIEEIEVYSDETKEDISIYAYIKGPQSEISEYRNKCLSMLQGASTGKASGLSSKAQFTIAEQLLTDLENSSLNVVLVLSDTAALNEATEKWITRSQKVLDRIHVSANLSEVQKTVVSHRFTQLLPFFAASDPEDERIVSLYPDNTGKWIDHQNSIVTLSSEELGASCDVDLRTFIAMSARANARDFTRIFDKNLPVIKILEAQTDTDEILICAADFIANFTLNHLRCSVGCELSSNQMEKVRIITKLFSKLDCPDLLSYFGKDHDKLSFNTSSGAFRYVTQLK